MWIYILISIFFVSPSLEENEIHVSIYRCEVGCGQLPNVDMKYDPDISKPLSSNQPHSVS